MFVFPHPQRTNSGVSRSGDTRTYSPQSTQVNATSRSRNDFTTGWKSCFPKLSHELKCTATLTCQCSTFEEFTSEENADARVASCSTISFSFHELAAPFARANSFRM